MNTMTPVSARSSVGTVSFCIVFLEFRMKRKVVRLSVGAIGPL
jgi:hypothetical protein